MEKSKKYVEREKNMLPKNVYENRMNMKFGILTKASDNMKMIMNNDFAKEYLEKFQEKMKVDQEM